MKRYDPALKYNNMVEHHEGEWVKYVDVEKMEIALKVISIWAEHPDTTLEEIRQKALEGLGKWI